MFKYHKLRVWEYKSVFFRNFVLTKFRQERKGGGFMVSTAQEDIKTSKRFLAEPKLSLPSIIALYVPVYIRSIQNIWPYIIDWMLRKQGWENMNSCFCTTDC